MGLGAVLVVEDDVRASEALAELLEAHGYAVARAYNGAEAFDLATKASPPPCLILLDLLMPVMDGWEFLRRKKGEAALANVPVIVLSALSSAIPSGVAAFIPKPVDVRRLISLVQQHCTKP
jgi:CheY-like chemotaxis protein